MGNMTITRKYIGQSWKVYHIFHQRVLWSPSFIRSLPQTLRQNYKKGILTAVFFFCRTLCSLGGVEETLSQAEMPIHSSWQKTHKNCVWTISAGNGTKVKSLHKKTSSSYSSVSSLSEILSFFSSAVSVSLFLSFLLFFLSLVSLLCFPPSSPSLHPPLSPPRPSRGSSSYSQMSWRRLEKGPRSSLGNSYTRLYRCPLTEAQRLKERDEVASVCLQKRRKFHRCISYHNCTCFRNLGCHLLTHTKGLDAEENIDICEY